ncbi:MAG: hypothetical protein ABFS39_03960 [Pseudomonadota bacterium]
MKKLMTPIALLVFVGSLNAATDAEIYHGFAKGNPDLETGATYEIARSAVQPGIGSGSDGMRSRVASDNQIYHGFERGNPDLWSGSSGYSVAVVPGIGSSSHGRRHSTVTGNYIYHGFEKDNPDL